MPTPREVVAEIYAKETREPQKNLCGSMRVMVGVLSGATFVNELLQNAGDAMHLKSDRISSTVQFTLTQNYLVMTHPGKFFDENDVRGICRIADDEREKLSQLEQTGEKGIGFRSLFSQTDEVFIRTGDLIFRFDKHHEKWRGKDHEYPWQIIPIETKQEELPNEVATLFRADRVCFALRLATAEKRKDVKQAVHDVLNLSVQAVFLRAIESIKFHDVVDMTNWSLTRKVVSSDTHDEVTREVVTVSKDIDGKKTTHAWSVFSCDVKLSEEVYQRARQTPDLPKKYKTRDAIRLQYAIPEHETLSRVDKGGVAVTLLTKIASSELPFWVNAPFQLSANRKELTDDQNLTFWNNFWRTQVMQHHIGVLAYIASSESFASVPMLVMKKDFVEGEYADRNAKMVRRLLKTRTIVKTQSGLLRPIEGALVDVHGFLKLFGREEQKVITLHSDYAQDAAVVNALIEFGAHAFDGESVVNTVTEKSRFPLANDPQRNRTLIKMVLASLNELREKKSDEVIKKIRTKLTKTEFVLNREGELVTPDRIFIADETFQKFEFETPFPVIDPELELTDVEQASLRLIGLQQLSFPLALAFISNQESKKLIAFTQELIARQSSFTEEDWKKIPANLKWVVGDSNVLPVSDVYPRAAMGAFDLDALIAGSSCDFLMTDQYPHSSQAKKFFEKSGLVFKPTEQHLIKIFEIVAQDRVRNIQFVQLLFDCADLEMRTYLIELIKKTQKAKLQLLVDVGDETQFSNADECYVSDHFNPAMKLQKIIPHLNFVSTVYVREQDDIDQWRMLLVQLGASEKLEFTDRGTLKRDDALALPNGPTQKPAVVKQYVEFLLTSRNEGGAEHCAEACRAPRYLHQHSVYQLISSKWLDSFLELPIFWTVLKQNWSFVEKHPTLYHCAWGDVAAYGSLLFYAEQHCLRVAGKPLRQLHSPQLLSPIGEFLPKSFKQVLGAQELSSPQQTRLGFRNSFSYEEIVSILRELPKYSVTAGMKKVIVILYNALLQLPSGQHPKEIEDDLQLLGADDQFHSAKELFLIPGIFVPSSLAHPNILFHEMKTTAQQRSLRDLLGVRLLNANDFKLKHEDRATPSELMKLFERRAAYVVWSEYEFDHSPQGQLPLREYVATAHAALLAQLKTRVIKTIPTITLLFEEIFSLIETVFLTSKVLYHTPFTSNLSAQTRLAQKIRAVFNLKLPATELWDLLLGNKDVLDGSKPLTDDDKQFLEGLSTRRKNKRNDDDDNDSDHSESSASSSTKRARSAAASPAKADDDVYERSTSQSTFAENYAQAKVAEAFVFQQLKTGYENLLADERVLSVEQQQNGDVIVTYADKVKKLRWMNAAHDRGKPYDLVMKTYSRSDDGDLTLTKKKYIEVKSTRVSGDDLTAYFSANEISLAINPRHSKKFRSIEESYKLFGVFMTNRETVDHLQEIENPAAAFKGRFKVALR